jgi:hypothetical protein
MAQRSAVGRPGQFGDFRRECIQRLERASLKATDRAARAALTDIRGAMAGAGLGKLGNALGAGSDLQKGRGVRRFAGGGFRASGWVYLRSRSDRAVGAIEAYTEGAEITPKRSRWLWISTDEIPRRAGRYRMTPALYNSTGLNSRIGPLVQIPGRHRGEALLIVRNVTVDRFGRRGKARRLPKRGGVGASRERRNFIVAFVGIRRTSRSARVSPRQIISLQVARLPDYRAAAMRSDGFER